MSRFKRIKNKTTKKSSVSIDEKISALNKELEKTGMLSEKMTTSNVYSTSTFVPADPGGEFPIPDTTGVTGSGFTQPVSGDPDDPSNWPNAFTDNSWMRNSNTVNGEANQPIIASFDDALFATDTSGRYPTGGAGIAFGNQAFGVSVGYIRNGFYRQVLKPGLLGGTVTVPQDAVGAPHFGLFGEYFPADETRQKILKMASARYAAVVGSPTIPVKAWTPHNTFHMGSFADYSGPKVTVDGQNYVLQTFQMYTKSNTFFVNPTPATTTNPIFRGIGDIEYHGPITPGRLFGLSDQGYNYLDGRSRRREGVRTIYRTAGGGVSPKGIGTGNTYSFTRGPRLRPVQPVADPTTTTQTQQSPPEESESPNIPAPESSPDKPFTSPNPTSPPNIPPLPAPKTQPGNYEGRGGRILDPTGLDSRAVKLGYNDELYPLNPTRYYTTQVDLSQDILSSLMNAEFYSAASRGESPNYDNAEINKAKADVAKARENLDNWNRWKQNTGYTWKGAISDREYDKQKALEKELKDKELDKQIDQLEKDKAQAEADAEAAATEARNLIAKFGLDVALLLFGPGILKLAGNALGKLPIVAKFFKLSKAAQKAQIDDALRAAKTAKTGNLSSALRGATDDIIDNLDDIIMKTDSSQALKFKDALIDAVDAGDEQAIRRIVQQIKNSKFKNQVPTGGVSGKINIPKSTKSEFGRPQGSMGGGYDPGADYGSLVQSYKVKGKLLNEATKLGHFEPEELNVDIEKLRKGIMPEYPKKPPAKMVDGYHQDSKLKPKELNKEPYLKISEKDLIRNHRLKPNEAQEMMQTIDRINDHIKEHPEDLIHAQMRYPIDDPRLAELNWRMDQMLDAGEEYLDSNFKENKKLFKRATEHTLKNIKVTDPKYVQQKYDELRGTFKPKKTKLVGRLGKHLNKYESKSLFKHVSSDDFKKISERKLEKKKFLEKKEQERLDYINDISAEMDEFRSDWRKDISESDFTNITKGNKVGQTFQHVSGATITLDNTMSDPSDQPSQVTLDLGFGEKITVDAPSGNEYGIAGVTKPLDKKVMQKQSVKTAEEINDQIEASEKASESKSARVPVETGDLGYKSTDQILAEVGDQWTYLEYMSMLDAIADKAAAAEEPIAKAIAEYSPTGSTPGDVPISLIDAQEAITNARNKAEQALHQAWERYNKVPYLPSVPDESEEGISSDDIKFLNKQQTLVNLTKGLGAIGLPNDFAQWTINYAKGDMKPITKFSPGMERQVRNLVLDKFKKNPNAKTVDIQYGDYGFGAKALPTRLGLGRFNATKLDNGKIRIQDTFNVDKDFTTIGFADIVPGLQKTADRLVDISYKTRNIKGRTDKGGITIDVLIDSGFVKKKRGSAFNKIKKFRNK